MPPLQTSCTQRVPMCERVFAFVLAEPYDGQGAKEAVRELWELGDDDDPARDMPAWEARLLLVAACAMLERDCRELIEEDDYNWGPDEDTPEAWSEWPGEDHPESLLERVRTLRQELAELEFVEQVMKE